MRAMFDEECYGWLHHDHSFEPVSMPKEWGGIDRRGMQIERSRQRKGYVCELVYGVDGHPSKAEIEKANSEFLRWLKGEE